MTAVFIIMNLLFTITLQGEETEACVPLYCMTVNDRWAMAPGGGGDAKGNPALKPGL